jgi:hypothetical protein
MHREEACDLFYEGVVDTLVWSGSLMDAPIIKRFFRRRHLVGEWCPTADCLTSRSGSSIAAPVYGAIT